MSCVNKSSKEFKTLAANNNISSNTLELIVHKYWIETGSEERFPSDVYIQAQLGNTWYQEKIPEVRKLWSDRYSSPLRFTSYDELQRAYDEAKKYFPEGAIVYYRDAKNNYVLSVKRPIEDTYNTAADFFSEDFATAKTLDLGLKEGETYTIDKVQELWQRFNTDRTSKPLADKVFELAKQLGIQVSFGNDLPFGTIGRYRNDNTILYKKSMFERDTTNDKKAPILLHEVIHAISVYALSDSTRNWQRSKNLDKFRTEVTTVFNELKDNSILRGERGIHDAKEFVAELANPVFRRKLQDIDTTNNSKRSIWQKIIDAFKSLLGIHTSSPYYNRMMKALDTAINAFDIDSYMRYNGLKAPLMSAYNDHRAEFEQMSTDEIKTMLKNAINDKGLTLDNKNNYEQRNIEQGLQRGGNILGEALSLLKEKEYERHGENEGKTDESQSLRAGVHEKFARQQRKLIKWAKDNSELIVEPDDYFDETFGNSSVKGTESKVWKDSKKGTVIKSIKPSHYATLQALLERIAIHNTLFPSTAMTVQGIGTSDKGISIIVEQPLIEDSGIIPTFEEIENYMTSLGFTHTKGRGVNSEYVKDRFLVADIRPENVIKQPNGDLAVIDCFAKYQEVPSSQPTTATDARLNLLIDSMSRDELIDELNTIKQEYSDYDMIDEMKNAAPSPKGKFTFDDGTTVNVPFTPNEQQAHALNVMNDFIMGRGTSDTAMTLSGYAGTGKTSLMEIIASKFANDWGHQVAFSASTNKATAVLKSKVSKLGYNAKTLNKLFGLAVELGDSEILDTRRLQAAQREAKIDWGTTVVVDEASMINEYNYNKMLEVAQELGIKIIFVGDRAQLPPVGDKLISPVFRTTKGKVIELTKVERTGDNAILREATDLRNGKKLSFESSFNDEGKGVAYTDKAAIADDVIKQFIPKLKEDKDFFRILTFTNASAADYNKRVRQLLGYNDPIPRVGETLMGYSQWGYNEDTGEPEFLNSESYKVTEVRKSIQKSFNVGGHHVVMTAVPVTLQDSLGNYHTFEIMDVKQNKANLEGATLLANEKNKLWKRYWQLRRAKLPTKEVRATINAIDKFLFVNDYIYGKDANGNLIKVNGKPVTWQNKVFDFGYAMTTHKSQGSTFTHVLVDENNIEAYTENTSVDINDASTAIPNVDVGKVREVGEGDVMTSSEDVGLFGPDEEGFVTPEETQKTQPKKQNDAINMRQMLNYVAITRATDTVTVLSRNTKKEDTPLNHLKEKNAEKTIQETPRPEVPVTPERPLRPISDRFKLHNSATASSQPISWARTSNNNYEVSTAGDKRFSALVATFKKGTTWNGQDIGGKTIESVYQTIIKKSRKGQPPAKDSVLNIDNLGAYTEGGGRILKDDFPLVTEELMNKLDNYFLGDGKLTKDDFEEFSYYMGYLPLWKLWAEQHPEEMSDLRQKAQGKVLTDKYASTRVSQARALSDILNDSIINPQGNRSSNITGEQITYTPKGQPTRTYTIVGTHIYNDKGVEVYKEDGADRNGIYANLAVKQGRAVTVEHNGKKYVVNGKGQIISVATKQIMKWGDENGDRKAILAKAQETYDRNESAQIIEHIDKNMPFVDMMSDEENEQFLRNHHILDDAQAMINKSSIAPSELKVIGSNLISRFGNKHSYGCVTYTANNGYVCNYKGEGDFDIIQTFELDNNINSIANEEEGRNSKAFDRLSVRDEMSKRKRNSDSYNIEERGTVRNNVGLDRQAPQGESIQLENNDDSTEHTEKGFIKTGWDGTNHPRYMSIDALEEMGFDDTPNGEDIPFMTTPNGEIYGYVTPDHKKMWLDREAMKPEHGIHEYTHLWDFYVQQKNPKLWKRGVELMKEIPMWKKIAENEHYGKRWAEKGITGEELERRIASEVHARITGKDGANYLDDLAKKKGFKDIVAKLKAWLLETWQNLKSTFSKWSDEDIKKLSLNDFNAMTLRDFADALDLKNAPTIEQEQKTVHEKDNPENFNDKKTSEDIINNNSITVSLPNYNYFNDLHEDTVIDSAWKEPLLKELDEQLNTENTTEENNEILRKMNDIFKASTEDDIKTQHSLEKEKEIQHDMDEYDKLNTQFDNLFNGMITEGNDEHETLDDMAKEFNDERIAFKASEIRHVAELLGDYLSDMITKIQTKQGTVEELFPELRFKDNPDFSKMSRLEIVQKIGIDNLIARAKYDFDPQNDVLGIDNMITSLKAQLVVENWDAMMLLASDVFNLNEGFGIKRDYRNSKFDLNETKNQVAYDDFNDYKDEEDIEENEGDSQEHWQIESMTIDVLNSMSALVRQAIHECYVLDNNNNRVLDEDWKLPLRVTPRKATNSILRWVRGSGSLEDMVNKLKAKQGKNPWLQQLITRLTDKTGNEADFQSQFYNVFMKPYQLYSIVRLDNGKYSTMPVNAHPALTEAMNSITAQFKMGEHPLFTASGKIKASLLGSKEGKEDTFTLHKAHAALQTIMDRLNHGEEISDEMVKEAAKNLAGAYRILGYPVSEDMVAEVLDADTIKDLTFKIGYINKALDSELATQRRLAGTPNERQYDPFAFGKDNYIGGTLRNFLTPITESLEDTAVSAFYDSGKMYQSYVTPSFMTKLMTKFKSLKGQEFDDFIEENYGKSEWFGKRKGRIMHWRNTMLRMLVNDENARDVFDFKVELNFNKHNYMRTMSDSEYTLSIIAEYFGESKDRDNVAAWFRMPMQSNKPSSEFFKFYSYRRSNYKDTIVNQLYDMFLQEISRIQTVKMRNKGKNDIGFIKNFDTNGRKFNFLPFFNSYLENTDIEGRNLLKNKATDNRLAELLQKKTDSTKELASEEEAELERYANIAIRNYMEERVAEILDDWDKSGIIEASRAIKNIVEDDTFLKEGAKLAEGEDKNEYVRQSLENFLWNDYLATKNILQLTVGDISFYKDAEDLQKRLAQLHAPGTRANLAATDYKGNPVSDGKYRTIILKDFDYYISNIIDNISEVFDRQIARASDNEKPQLIALKESLVGENGKYRNINVADAQGYSSPSSYRKKALLFGKWSRHAEDLYQKLLKGEYNFTDLKAAFQPLKPFVYTHLEKNIASGDSPIKTMYVPFQAKNSEYLLIMADAIIRGETLKSGKLSKPNLLRALYNVMEDSAYDGRVRDEKTGKVLQEGTYNGRGIDTVQFESAIKSGLQGSMNIEQFANMEGGEAAAYNYIMNQVYKTDGDGRRTTEYDTDNFVHEASFDDYCLQQEVPEHFKNHSQAHGSQIRMIIPSDLDLYKDPRRDAEHLNDEDNINYYEWTDPDGTKRRARADEFKREYEETIAANIRDDIAALYKEFKLDSTDKREKNIALSKILQREILSSPRYGVNLLQACSVDKKTGEFRIPKGDPIQAKRIEQLLNSIIKNRINKQKIAGGPIVQVTNFGTSKQLHIRFNDRQGGILKTKEEFLKEDNLVSQYKTYEKYTKERQAGIAYFEVFLPMWSNEIFEKFADEKGNIDMEAVENADPELLKMVSYRIPTEDKYSMAPMKAVGFMPKEAGDAIMLPYELTEIDDSDFDVDKRYVMRKELKIKTKPKSQILNALLDRVVESYNRQHKDKLQGDDKQAYKNAIDVYVSAKLQGSYRRDDRYVYNGKDYTQLISYLDRNVYRKVAYTTEQPKDIKVQRNNKIVDMTMAVLTNEMTADKILNPGGFDAPKKIGYMVAAYKNPANRDISWEKLQSMSIDELKDLSYTAKDLAWADTQIQFYRQNSASSNLIGVFAVNKVAHAILEGNGIYIDVDEICGNEPFTIAGMKFGGRMEMDGAFDTEGNRIGKTLGSMVSASADGVKDPVLNLMNINMTTANVLNTMLRLGMPFDEAALFLSQDVIGRMLREFNNRNLTNYVSLNQLINEYITAFEKKNEITENSNIRTEELTEEQLREGLLPTEHESTDYKVMVALQKLMALGNAMRNPTFATRFNSISSSVGPLIIDNLILEHKRDQFLDSNGDEGTTHFYDKDGNNVDIDDIFYDHPVLKEFARSIDIAKELFGDMPANSEKFREILSALPAYISNKIFSDKKLLSQFSDFFQSYMLVASGLVDATQLKYYIENFPKEFNKENYKEKYPNNALIQAIQVTMEKGRPVLKIKITGVDTTEKEELSSAWIDLHKENPELSKKLFFYNFFRAGIGFSPKTFMALVPMYLKEHLSNGNATYVDTFRNISDDISPDVVIDQFVRNNWNNNKLVPWRGGKGTKYKYDYQNGTLTVTNQEDMDKMDGATYIKTKAKGRVYMWKLLAADKNSMLYEMVTPLGNNGEYIEMSNSEIEKPISDTKEPIEDNSPSELSEPSSVDEGTSTVTKPNSERQEVHKVSEGANLIMKQWQNVGKKATMDDAENMVESIKKNPRQYSKFVANVLKQKGIDVNRDQAIDEFLKLC